MTEKKLTESEIMKALECCRTNIMADCKRCNLRLEDGTIRPYCTTILIGNALDLINRKNEEIYRLEQNLKEAHIDIKEHLANIDRLTEIEEAHHAQNGELRQEVERLKKMKIIGTTDWLTKGMSAEQIAEEKANAIAECNAEIRAEARAEAIKAVIERAKEETMLTDKFGEVILASDLDQIAKEMGCGE